MSNNSIAPNRNASFITTALLLLTFGCAELDLEDPAASGGRRSDIDDGGMNIDVNTDTETEKERETGSVPNAVSEKKKECTQENAKEVCGESYFCVDGFCCDTQCNGECTACNLSGREGICTPIEVGLDPHEECGICKACNGDANSPQCIAAARASDIKADCEVCQMCNGDADNPACIPVPAGEDPLEDCNVSDVTSCSTNGWCDGMGACEYYNFQSSCGAPLCDDGTLYASRCDGAGECAISPSDCAGYACATDITCYDSCEHNEECASSFICQDGVCVAETPGEPGAPCTTASACLSGFCVDGVCCESRCSANCMACDSSGEEGRCTPVPANTDPKKDCPTCFACDTQQRCVPVPQGSDYKDDCIEDSEPNGCGPTGQCNGKGACEYWDETRECGESSCKDLPHVSTLKIEHCNGNGNCVENDKLTCGTFRCAETMDACKTSCQTEADCVEDATCADGLCLGTKPLGEACNNGFECLEGYCVDGRCCESDCDGKCQRCDMNDSGLCEPVADLTDPDSDCGQCQACFDGGCSNVPAGDDPKDDCTEGPPGECAHTGQCDGNGACRIRGEDYPCGQQCEDEQVVDLYCSGEGIGASFCNVEGTVDDCQGYLSCDAFIDSCPLTCLLDTECLTGYYCDTDNNCKPDLTDGQACNADHECSSSACVDDVCCDAPCDGVCEACNLAEKEGSCSPIPHGSDDPAQSCDDGIYCNGEDYCDGEGGDGRGACIHDGNPCNETDDNRCNDCNEEEGSCTQPEGTACGDTSDNDCTNPDTCDNAGTCAANHAADNTPCTSDDNSATDDICQDGICNHIAASDTDDDGIPDDDDNCPDKSNTEQTDTDLDGYGDACDVCANNPQGYSAGCENLKVLTIWNTTDTSGTELHPVFKIVNDGSLSVSIDGLKLVYWYTYDASVEEDQQAVSCYFAAMDTSGDNHCSSIQFSVSQLDNSEITSYADNAWSWTLSYSGELSAGEAIEKLDASLHTPSWQIFQYENDYSYNACTDFCEAPTVTLYRNSQLIWGHEPDSGVI